MIHTENSNSQPFIAKFNNSNDFFGLSAFVLNPQNTIKQITITGPIFFTCHALWLKRNGVDFKILNIHDRTTGKIYYERNFSNERNFI